MSEPKVLELAGSTCFSCVESLDDVDWVATSTFHVGPWAVGVRSTSAATDTALRHILAAHLLDTEAPPYFSALVSEAAPDNGNAQSFNFLYRSSDTLVRTRAPGRVVRTLLHYLSDLVPTDPVTPNTPVRLRATGLVVGGQAIVAPEDLRTEMAAIESRLNGVGMRVIDAPVLLLEPGTLEPGTLEPGTLEPGTGHVVVPEPAITVDGDALAEYERAHPSPRRELAPVQPGRYPIAAWALLTGADAVGPIGRAEAVAAAAQLVANADVVGAQRALDVIAGALQATPVSGIWWQEPNEVVAQLRALVNGA